MALLQNGLGAGGDEEQQIVPQFVEGLVHVFWGTERPPHAYDVDETHSFDFLLGGQKLLHLHEHVRAKTVDR